MSVILLSTLAQLSMSSPAVAVSVHGWVQIDYGQGRANLSRFTDINEGASIITHENATAQIRLASGSLLRLGPSTEVSLTQLEHNTPAGQRKETLRLRVGRVWARVTHLFGTGSKFEMQTSTAVAGVRGTSFVAEAGPESERFTLVEGAIDLLRDGAAQRLDHPGAFLESGPQGFGAPGTLDASSMDALLGDIAGAARATAALGERRATQTSSGGGGAAAGGGAARSASRSDIVGPQGLVDAPVATGPLLPSAPGASSNDPAIVDIRINLPQ